jgi:dienelactone hydrolase
MTSGRSFAGSAGTQSCWAGQEAIAHTLAYDARIMGDYSIPTETAASVKAPTLVLADGADMPFMRESTQALADAIPDGQVRYLEDQRHDVDPTVLVPALKEFFS